MASYTFLGGFMKKTFQVIGIITLLFGSFLYTEEVATTSKLSDDLLNEIKTKADSYKVEPKEAIIKNGTIVPGVNGKKVDIKKSYDNMRQIGYFNEKLLIYKRIMVKNNLEENKDKYIVSGNQSKKEISILFKVNQNMDLNNIVYILNKEKVKGTFFINSSFLENNHNYVIRLIEDGHTVGNLSNNLDYSDSDFVWMKTILTSSLQKHNYCYTEKADDEVIDICSLQNSYTVMPRLVVKNRLFTMVKNNLSPGLIVVININNNTVSELEYMIDYVKSKGYEIKPLEKLLFSE